MSIEKFHALQDLLGGSVISHVVRAEQAFVSVECDSKSTKCGLYMVSWWGEDDRPLPVGFTRFEFIMPQGGMFSIMCYDEPKNYETLISPDEWIVIFRSVEKHGNTGRDPYTQF